MNGGGETAMFRNFGDFLVAAMPIILVLLILTLL